MPEKTKGSGGTKALHVHIPILLVEKIEEVQFKFRYRNRVESMKALIEVGLRHTSELGRKIRRDR